MLKQLFVPWVILHTKNVLLTFKLRAFFVLCICKFFIIKTIFNFKDVKKMFFTEKKGAFQQIAVFYRLCFFIVEFV